MGMVGRYLSLVNTAHLVVQMNEAFEKRDLKTV